MDAWLLLALEVNLGIEVNTKLESRREWVAPKLRKIDIERITAAGKGTNADGIHTTRHS